MDTKFIKVGGIRFGYLETGDPDGPLAILMHGFPDHAHTWDYLLADLASEGIHGVAPFLRGYHPTSVASDGVYQTAASVHDMVGLMRALGYERASFVGHDWGAIIAHGIGVLFPEYVERLVTMAVPHGPGMLKGFMSFEQIQRSWYAWFFLSPGAVDIVRADDFAWLDKLWALWEPRFQPSGAYMTQVKASVGLNLEATLGYYRAMLSGQHSDPGLASDQIAMLGGQIGLPTLYMHGVEDRCILPQWIDGMDAVVKDLRVQMVQNAAHFLHLRQPAIVNRAVVDFITQGGGS